MDVCPSATRTAKSQVKIPVGQLGGHDVERRRLRKLGPVFHTELLDPPPARSAGDPARVASDLPSTEIASGIFVMNSGSYIGVVPFLGDA